MEELQAVLEAEALVVAVLADGLALDVLHGEVGLTLICRAGFVDPGDVVVLNGFAGLPVIYYLDRLGYQWDMRFAGWPPQRGYCKKEALRRRCSCRRFPVKVRRARLPEFLSKMILRQNALWVVYGVFVGAALQERVLKVELLLLAELEQAGFTPSLFPGAQGLRRFTAREGRE